MNNTLLSSALGISIFLGGCSDGKQVLEDVKYAVEQVSQGTHTILCTKKGNNDKWECNNNGIELSRETHNKNIYYIGNNPRNINCPISWMSPQRQANIPGIKNKAVWNCGVQKRQTEIGLHFN